MLSKNPNNYENQKLRGLKRKYEAILAHGGGCKICGYNRNIGVLEFHHRNPDEKEFQIDMRAFSNTNLEKLQKELNKCDLLCSNCHRELHCSDLFLDNVKETIKECQKKSFSSTSGQVCPVCGKKFKKTKGKIYCSEECRWKDKNYPSVEEIEEQYKILQSWEKVAQHFGITRRIVQGIRNRANKLKT